ncbi:MAG TPA: hypothetical protein VK849_10170 [Longimicrobiales bacterium]|nr:hypothetical protein [Longimicrobiales bacterium]
MSLELVSVAEFLGEARGVRDALRTAGLGVVVREAGSRTRLDSPRQLLEAGEVSLALVPGDALARLDEERCVVGAVLPRAEPRDLLLPARPTHGTLVSLPPRSRVGVSGRRRSAFLRAHRPDIQPVAAWNGGGPGEVLDAGVVDALILGAAESRRWSVAHRATEALDAKVWIPSPGQGTPVLLCRVGDLAALECAALVDQASARAAWEAERVVRESLAPDGDGPLGVLALPYGRWIRVWGMVVSQDGRAVVRGDITGSLDHPRGAGLALAELLLARGAASIIGTEVP